MQHEEIEIQLWDYVDGTCNKQDHERITFLIASDIEWQALYHEILALNNTLSSNTTIEKLPDSFSNSVMTSIQSSTKEKRSTAWLDWGIKGVAVFFVISILSTLLYTLAQVDWKLTDSKPSAISFNKIQLPHFDTNIQLSNGTLYAISFMALIMVLILIDKLLVQHSKIRTI